MTLQVEDVFKSRPHGLGTRKGILEDRGVEGAELLLFLRAYLYCQINRLTVIQKAVACFKSSIAGFREDGSLF